MATMALESRAGALRACVQEHVDITLNEVGEQAFDIILRDVSPEYRNTFVKLYNQTVQGIKQNTMEELEVICSEVGLWKKLESLDALSKEVSMNTSQKTLEALRVSATSEKPEDLLRKAAIALKRKEKESLEQQLRGLKEKEAEFLGQAQERRGKVAELLGTIESVGTKLN
ncbi:hypothetical protein HOP50_09g55660 [Chloropicon primus]|uniref:Uncharacterized protein n=2 Tax=Chloropicon primus TaxID=1764295 RepID=A0A5B8MUA1_9CHLO|nr:hypothetical protein A3770_09p55400 [Chloropicon primus]UPR02240.1 hypothetical protein HOP50_09g55660 [Chloropicon primus]|eukprot:QDZ23022.1 hypothetical protein A3770_09p55400 [Chloropicon primus]